MDLVTHFLDRNFWDMVTHAPVVNSKFEKILEKIKKI